MANLSVFMHVWITSRVLDSAKKRGWVKEMHSCGACRKCCRFWCISEGKHVGGWWHIFSPYLLQKTIAVCKDENWNVSITSTIWTSQSTCRQSIWLCNKIIFLCMQTHRIQCVACGKVYEQCMLQMHWRWHFCSHSNYYPLGWLKAKGWMNCLLIICVYLRACNLQCWPSADCTPRPTCQVAKLCRNQSQDQMVIAGFRCLWHSASLKSPGRLPLCQTNIHTCKYKQNEWRKWAKSFRFWVSFCIIDGQK